MLNDSVWSRVGADTMSKNLFALMVCFWTAIGIGTSMAGAYYTQNWELPWQFLLGVLIVAILGVIVATVSDNPLISLLGYLAVAIPFGMMLGPVVSLYTTASVVRVLFVTTGMVVVLGLVGVFIPDNLEGWGSWLLGALTTLLVGYFIVPIAGVFGLPIDRALNLWDWVGILIFGAYVVYDWNRAMRVAYSADNAIDCALAVYLDFVNIFIRLLRLTGSTKSSD